MATPAPAVRPASAHLSVPRGWADCLTGPPPGSRPSSVAALAACHAGGGAAAAVARGRRRGRHASGWPRPPRRIVSLNPTTTELLFALGAGARLVGRTELRATTPPAAARRARAWATGFPPNVEAVAGARARPGRRSTRPPTNRGRGGTAPRRWASRCSRSAPTAWPTSPAPPGCWARCSARAAAADSLAAAYRRGARAIARTRARIRPAARPTRRSRGVGPAADRARRGQLRERDGRARRGAQRLRRCLRLRPLPSPSRRFAVPRRRVRRRHRRRDSPTDLARRPEWRAVARSESTACSCSPIPLSPVPHRARRPPSTPYAGALDSAFNTSIRKETSP